jgi:hypothetical protein
VTPRLAEQLFEVRRLPVGREVQVVGRAWLGIPDTTHHRGFGRGGAHHPLIDAAAEFIGTLAS